MNFEASIAHQQSVMNDPTVQDKSVLNPKVGCLVHRADHGYGGMGDYKSKPVAEYDDWKTALHEIALLGHYVDWKGKPMHFDSPPWEQDIWHVDTAKRHTMGAITYYITKLPDPLPRNRIPDGA